MKKYVISYHTSQAARAVDLEDWITISKLIFIWYKKINVSSQQIIFKWIGYLGFYYILVLHSHPPRRLPAVLSELLINIPFALFTRMFISINWLHFTINFFRAHSCNAFQDTLQIQEQWLNGGISKLWQAMVSCLEAQKEIWLWPFSQGAKNFPLRARFGKQKKTKKQQVCQIQFSFQCYW